MIVTREEMISLEQASFDAGATAESLMEEVGAELAERVARVHGVDSTSILICAGKGNNAGDAFVFANEFWKSARHHGWQSKTLWVWLACGEDQHALGKLAYKKLNALVPEIRIVKSIDDVEWLASNSSELTGAPLLIIDALLGLGAHGPLREPIRSATRFINHIKHEHNCSVIAIDLPTGLDVDTGEVDIDAVVADVTLTIGLPKVGLLSDKATNHVGRLDVIRLPEFDSLIPSMPFAREASERGQLTTRGSFQGIVHPRKFDSHKGNFGRVGILAGSIGTTGAAILCSTAAIRSGAGLVTLLTKEETYSILAASSPPEVMVKPIRSPLEAMDMPFDVVAIGPGLGQGKDNAERKYCSAVSKLIEQWPKPMVVDADGLNLLAANSLDPLRRSVGPRLLTPHPKEMQRLLTRLHEELSSGRKESSKPSRVDIVRYFTDLLPVILLLKGARTIVGEKDRPIAYNTTGNPGMATGGMGDALTGICAGIAAAGHALYDSARLAAWIHGRAADLALQSKAQSEESLIVTDLFEFIGAAFREMR